MSDRPQPHATAVVARWRAAFPSLGARLVGLFIVFALGVAITFLFGLSALQHGGWREYVASRTPESSLAPVA